ncbi:MAG: TolC family protein [Bacteroidales bacterium]|jgi:cobalt-zinc-cadmium efflux system outer membrane protein|nr:TolC family protein [Bacteroidales bacterium]
MNTELSVLPKAKYLLSTFFLTCSFSAFSQQLVPLTYQDYMDKVTKGNLEYAAEQLNVQVSEAEIVAAKVFNDPNLAATYYYNENNSLQMGEGFEFELSKTFSFGKRSAGIALANNQKELTEAVLADYFRNLRAAATVSYLEALKQEELYRVKQESYNDFRQLAVSDSIRFVLGKIKELDATQSKLEAGIMYNELLQAKVELYNAFADLNLLTGSAENTALYQPNASMKLEPRLFILSSLVSTAVDNRTDVIVARKNSQLASGELLVTRRERNTDIDVSLGLSKNARVYNDEAPAPPFTGISAGLSIPLKFSNFNKGAVKAAQFREQQAEVQYQQVQLQVQTEVMQAYRSYLSLAEQLKRFENDMLDKAKEVLEGKRYSHQRGEVSLLEVLDAQRTYNDVKVQYIETLFNYCVAVVELEKSAGIWDVNLQ